MHAKLGQNFLADLAILQFEAESADVQGKSVLEIGAGDGRLTERLLACGAAHVSAVEFDPKLAKQLRMKFQRQRRVKVHECDIPEFGEDARYNAIVGNIPYYITSPILLKLSRMGFDRAVLCLQKEVVERLLSAPGSGNYGRLSVFAQLAFRMEFLALVPNYAFEPKPKVDSCIISIEKTGFAMDADSEKAIGAIFSHRKKSVKNAIVDARLELFGSRDKGIANEAAKRIKYAERKVFTLAPSEALEVAEELVKSWKTKR